MPNFRTVKRRVDAIDAKEHVRKRSGAKAARDRFRPTRVMSTANLLPLERVQIDHTRIDVVVVNEGDRLPIGRPWLRLAIDVASRVVLGFSVSLEGPSVVSVALTLVLRSPSTIGRRPGASGRFVASSSGHCASSAGSLRPRAHRQARGVSDHFQPANNYRNAPATSAYVTRHFSSKQARCKFLLSGLFERKFPLFKTSYV